MYDSLISLGEQNSELRGLTRTYTFNKQVGNCFYVERHDQNQQRHFYPINVRLTPTKTGYNVL